MTTDYPIYEKDGRTQLAPTPAAEVRLKFDGWRKREDPAGQQAAPAVDPTAEGPASEMPAAGKAKQRSKNPTTE